MPHHSSIELFASSFKPPENISIWEANACDLLFLHLSRLPSNYVDGTKVENIWSVPYFLSSSCIFNFYQEDEWKIKVSAILKFARQLISILATQVDAPTLALRLFLLAAQIADECGFEDLTYDLYVQAFTVYEDSISESRAQLQAITLVIGTLQGARVFGVDNYDTLITKAALHGAKLLKKSHQASAVHLASHLWWQEPVLIIEGEGGGEGEVGKVGESKKDLDKPSPREDGSDNAKAVSSSRTDSYLLLRMTYLHSILTRTASVFSSVSRSRCGLPIPLLRKSSQCSFTAIPSINTCTTLTKVHQRLVFFRCFVNCPKLTSLHEGGT